MRQLILFKNGVNVGVFDRGAMQRYVDKGRRDDEHARFWAFEDGKLTYHYRTQQEIDDELELRARIESLEGERDARDENETS